MNFSESVLYVVATPLGNLEDITIRALNTLKECDLILAENQSHSRPLLKAHQITTEIRSLPKISKENEKKVLQLFQDRKKIALISDAGTPGISDPGSNLVRLARKEKINIVPIPGASSMTAILSVCGFQTNPTLYLGFLPEKKTAKKNQLQNYSNFEGLIVILESVHKMTDLIEIIRDIFPASNLLIGREITKIYEEFLFFHSPKELKYENLRLKGEFIVLINNRLKKIAKENSRFTETIIE